MTCSPCQSVNKPPALPSSAPGLLAGLGDTMVDWWPPNPGIIFKLGCDLSTVNHTGVRCLAGQIFTCIWVPST